MRKSRFTEAQIIGMTKEQEAGMATAEVCRKHGLNPSLHPTSVAWLMGLQEGPQT
jgi:transposase-like protein